MMMRALALIGLASAMPAAATVTIQTKSPIALGSLDLAPVSGFAKFDDFTSFGLTNEHLVAVSILFAARINGTVDAVNTAAGGNAGSRRRDISASYTLNAGVAGHHLRVVASDTDPQTKTGVAGRGTVVTLNGINPLVLGADTLTSRFAPFLNGPVRFAYAADAVFTPVPAPDVVFGTPEITGGRALISLVYFSTVPEPATWALLVGGFGLVGVSLRRRSVFRAA